MKMAQEEDKLADKQDQKDNEDDRLDDEKDRTAMARNEEAQNFLIQTCTGCKPAPSAQEKAARNKVVRENDPQQLFGGDSPSSPASSQHHSTNEEEV